MGDLIRRSDLIEAMTEVYKKHYAGDVSASGFTIAMEMVRKQPTAYNVEKVVETLEENAFDYYLCDGEMVDLKDAIYIVKRGGVDERA